MKQFLNCFALIILSFFITSPVRSADFATNIDQTYTLTASGAEVVESITITNLTDLTFPTGFSLLLNSNQINGLSVTDVNQQAIKFEPQPVAGALKLTLHFPKAVVGQTKSQTYRLEYKNPDVRLTANFPQYIIPKTVLLDQSSRTNTTVIIPKNICPQPKIFPDHLTATDNDTFITVGYDQTVTDRSVTILCHPNRYLRVKLQYYLNNPTMTPVETQVTLPPDTVGQRFIFDSVQPKPIRLSPDRDGNRIATYKLEPKQNITVVVDARAVIANSAIFRQDPQPDSQLYTQAKNFWPVNNQIRHEVKKYASAQEIYRAILETANFNPDQFEKSGTRTGGNHFFTAPNNFNSEDFADAFITLCRSKGIPSRRVIGYIEPTNSQSQLYEYPDAKLHVYAEWYDAGSQTWIQADPFWGELNPTVDYRIIEDQSRLVLAIQGESDSLPLPAGLYPSPDRSLVQIETVDINEFAFPTPNLSATIKASLLNSILSTPAQLIINNFSDFALYNEPFELTPTDGSPATVVNLTRLDLNSQGIMPINFSSTTPFTLNSNYGPIPIKSTITDKTPQFAITAFLVLGASLIAVFTRRLLVHRRRK